jgi:hypothetical protein
MLSSSIVNARLAVLPFAPLQWWLAWGSLSCVSKYTRKNSLARFFGQLVYGAAVGGIVIIQITLYQYLSGTYNLEADRYVFALLLIESIITILVTFRWAYGEREKEKSQKTK